MMTTTTTQQNKRTFYIPPAVTSVLFMSPTPASGAVSDIKLSLRARQSAASMKH